jgi:2-polyprenyl-3-methyl-5-hydroxy-6-metoxy-1,4-benzoquinol methylase
VIENAKRDYHAHFSLLNPGRSDDETFRACSRYYDAELRPLLPPERTVRIVDVGCGFGHLIRYLCQLGYTSVGGVELDESLHREAVENVGPICEFVERGEGRDFLLGRADAFDVVTLIDVIEHFPLEEAAAMLRAIHHALRPGGFTILRTPNMANLLGVYSRHMDLTHQVGFTELSLMQLLRQAGFLHSGVHVPVFAGSRGARFRQRLNRWLHRVAYWLQDRVTPQSFEKNVVVWARKSKGADLQVI